MVKEKKKKLFLLKQSIKLYTNVFNQTKTHTNYSSIKNPRTKTHQQPNPNNFFTKHNINELTSICIFYSEPPKMSAFYIQIFQKPQHWYMKFSEFLPHFKKPTSDYAHISKIYEPISPICEIRRITYTEKAEDNFLWQCIEATLVVVRSLCQKRKGVG